MPQLATGAGQTEQDAGPSPDADQRYVALGVPCGRWQDPSGANSPPAAIIRQGEEFLLVGLSTLELFLFAVRPRRRSELLTAAEDAGADDPIELMESVIDHGLLILLGNDSDEDRRRLGGLRLQPIGIGLGDDGTEPGNCRIARHDLRPLLTCDYITYSVWAASDGRSLGAVCEQIGTFYGVGSDDVLRHIVQVLPGLLESGAAFLDSTPGGEAA
jgi:hypothetical protein